MITFILVSNRNERRSNEDSRRRSSVIRPSGMSSTIESQVNGKLDLTNSVVSECVVVSEQRNSPPRRRPCLVVQGNSIQTTTIAMSTKVGSMSGMDG